MIIDGLFSKQKRQIVYCVSTEERLQNAEIRIGDNKNRNNPVCGKVTMKAIKKGSKIVVNCNLKGRYLTVRLPGKNYLTLCEVKAYRGKCAGKRNDLCLYLVTFGIN